MTDPCPSPGRPDPAGRNRAVDLVRVGALALVVLGHWLKQGWYVDAGGALHRAGLVGIAPWTHPLTWAFQVMPLFFMVGGYANAVSWRHARGRGDGYAVWLAGRVGRLVRPVLPLLACWVLLAPVARTVDPDGAWLRVASRAALVPLWFLATYVVVVAAVPLTLAAWERWRCWTLAAGLLVVPLDVLGVAVGGSVLAGLNAALVWGTLHQLGYAWRDRAVPRPAALLVGLGALVAAVATVAFGPYGVSMVGVAGYGLDNADPPRLPLLLLGVAQAGLVLSLEPTLERLARRRRLWLGVVAVERRVMSIYLWHLPALALLTAVSLAAGGAGMRAYPGTPAWWAGQPLVLVLLVLVVAVLVLVVGRAEDPVPARQPRSSSLPLAEALAMAVALGLLAAHGLGDDGRSLLPVVSLAVLGVTELLLRRRTTGQIATSRLFTARR